MELFSRIRPRAGIILFCLGALYFTARGPWRAAGSVNSYDFASLYGATRCWLHGENPYDMRTVRQEVRDAGDDPATFPNADPPLSVYLPTAFPVLAPLGWMPWNAARIAWTLISVAAFALSVALLFRISSIGADEKWLLGAGILFFSPTSSGLSTGNPSVISCGLTLAAISLVIERKRPQRAALALAACLLGLAHCIKPQVSIAAVAALLLWGCWPTIAASILVPMVAAVVSLLRVAQIHRYGLWISTLRHGIGEASAPGGINDASPANYFSYHLVNAAAILRMWLHDGVMVSALVWIGAAVLAGCYVWLRRRRQSVQPLRDVAFCCALSLTVVYHRYYDAQVLLGVIPFLLTPAARAERTTPAIWAALLVLLFPLQAIVAESFRHIDPTSPGGFLLLRHQPVLMVMLSILIIPWRNKVTNKDGREALPDARVSKG